MKKISRNILLAVVSMLVVVGCDNMEGLSPRYGTIQFGTEEIRVSAKSRAFVDQEGIDDGSIPVYVHALINGSQQLYPVSGTAQGERIVQDQTTAKWLPRTSSNYRDWRAGSSYTFNGFAYTPTNATSSSMLTIKSYGKEIVVNQPSTYNPSQMVDYMLSHTFTVADGRVRPLVQLDLEHAMSLVEVRLVKHESINEAYIENVTMSGFFRSATMNCIAPAVYNSGASNEWNAALAGSDDTVYSFTPAPYTDQEGRVPMVTKGEEGEVVMAFLAIPQQMEMVNTLRVSFWVNEKFNFDDESEPDNFVHHEAEFKLYNYSPIVWRSGHRVVYTLEVDTGIHLQGVIAPWIDVDYIEGTVLPEIKYDEF